MTSGKVAIGRVLVSGGATGLGAAVCDAVAAAGGSPGVLDLNPPAVAGLPWAKADVTDNGEVEAGVRRVAEQLGGLDAVVTTAGVDRPGRLADVPADDWERVVRVNLLGTASVVRSALPFLAESANGHVVTVASTLGLRALSDATAYCAAKFGVVGFTRALAAELQGRTGVTMLIPGGMRTGFFDGRDEQYKPGPDAHLNDPREVAEAVVFALSRPAACAVRELVVCPDVEPSWP
ncbi:MAG: SDR family oxidoreductase [Hamadaea sp.]|nr:SDR family oxidoreductase [Hamadaea sp.]